MKETTDMSDDFLVLQELIERHGYSAKLLASWTGIASSTIYKYLSGAATIPLIIWRCLYERTLDASVLKLITGCVPHIAVPLVIKSIKVDAASLQHLIETRKKQIGCEELILKILADGKVDISDSRAIADYKRLFPQMINSEAQIFQAVTNEFSEISET